MSNPNDVIRSRAESAGHHVIALRGSTESLVKAASPAAGGVEAKRRALTTTRRARESECVMARLACTLRARMVVRERLRRRLMSVNDRRGFVGDSCTASVPELLGIHASLHLELNGSTGALERRGTGLRDEPLARWDGLAWADPSGTGLGKGPCGRWARTATTRVSGPW